MSAIARFGFEGGYIPSNVSIFSASFVSGRVVSGTAGTAVEATASGLTEFGNVINSNSSVTVAGISTDSIFYSCQFKRVSVNSNVSMSLVQFGNVWVEYAPTSSQVTFRRGKAASPGYDILYTSPATVNLGTNIWISVSGKFVLSATIGEIAITIDGTAYQSATNLNTSQAWSGTFTSNTMAPIYIPQGVSSASFSVSGAGGGGTAGNSRTGGAGGFVSGIVLVKSGQVYWVVAGSGGSGANAPGSPGGGTGAGFSGGGGGYSGIFTSSIASQGNAILVSGGGGAGGQSSGNGGAGGNPAAGGSALQGTSGGSGLGAGGGGYQGGNAGTGTPTTAQGGSNFLSSNVLSQINASGGGAAGGGVGAAGSNGSVLVSATLDKTKLIFGLGVDRNNILVGKPTLQLDDVAVNNSYTGSNSTGSFGISDNGIPPFITSRLVSFTSTGSNTSGWTVPGGNITASISGSDGIFITSSFYPRPLLEVIPSNIIPGANTVEGLNYYYNAFREGNSNTYIKPNISLGSPSGSVRGQNSVILNSFGSVGSFSTFEKDLGGKILYSEFLNGKIILSSSQFTNQNYFGSGVDGDIRYSISTNLGDGIVDGDYVVMNYSNLIIDSGVIISTSVKKRGLIIYVKENCIINGTITMTAFGSIGTLPSGFLMAKNVTTSSFNEYSSSLYSSAQLGGEQSNQPFTSGSSTSFNISSPYAAGGAAPGGSNGLPGANGINGQGGGGGGGANGGIVGGTSQTFGGGVGGNSNQGNLGSVTPGGVIYLIVGGQLVHSGTISSNGTAGTNATTGGGGSGGGSITILYGKNIINTGTIQAIGGAGGVGIFNGGAGGAGSIRISKILTN